VCPNVDSFDTPQAVTVCPVVLYVLVVTRAGTQIRLVGGHQVHRSRGELACVCKCGHWTRHEQSAYVLLSSRCWRLPELGPKLDWLEDIRSTGRVTYWTVCASVDT
jgi:hypothetical protein